MDENDLRCIIENSDTPFIINNMLDWDILKWDLNNWNEAFKEEILTFRMGNVEYSNDPQWENTTEIITGTFEEFINFDSKSNWLYFDYKHLCSWLLNAQDLQKQIDWSKFGFPNKTFKESTIWVGTKGAHTPCHADTYGCNLIAQIYGRKRWLLFPPNVDLKRTRMPYEESSVYSKINFYSPTKDTLKDVSNCRMVILEPGQVLFVPNGWWHYVENLQTSISINVWLDSKQDYDKHIEEAITLILIKALTSEVTEEQKKLIININENVEDLSLPSALDLLNKQIAAKNVCKSSTSSTSHNNTISNFIKFIDVLTAKEFDNFMDHQMSRFSSNISYNDKSLIRNNKAVDLNMLINVLTDSDVINLIKSKLLNKLNV